MMDREPTGVDVAGCARDDGGQKRLWQGTMPCGALAGGQADAPLDVDALTRPVDAGPAGEAGVLLAMPVLGGAAFQRVPYYKWGLLLLAFVFCLAVPWFMSPEEATFFPVWMLLLLVWRMDELAWAVGFQSWHVFERGTDGRVWLVNEQRWRGRVLSRKRMDLAQWQWLRVGSPEAGDSPCVVELQLGNRHYQTRVLTRVEGRSGPMREAEYAQAKSELLVLSAQIASLTGLTDRGYTTMY